MSRNSNSCFSPRYLVVIDFVAVIALMPCHNTFAQLEYHPVALSHVATTRENRAPGTTAFYDSFGAPMINNEGHVAFLGILRTDIPGANSSNDRGIWAGAPDSLTLVAREGDPAPNATGAGSALAYSSVAAPRLTDFNQISFQSGKALFGGPYEPDPPNQFSDLRRVDPDDGTAYGIRASNASLVDAETGEVVQYLSVSNVPENDLQISRISVSNIGDGSLTEQLATKGTVALFNRKMGETDIVIPRALISTLNAPMINPTGELAFPAFVDTGVPNVDVAMIAGSPGNLRIVALEAEQPAATTRLPVLGTDPNQGHHEYAQLMELGSINARGNVVFASALDASNPGGRSDPGFVSSGIFKNSGPTPSTAMFVAKDEIIVDVGSVKLTGGATDIVSNSQDDIAFVGSMIRGFGGVTLTNDLGLWASNGGKLRLIAREGDEAPGVNCDCTFSSFSNLHLNENGRIAFLTRLDGGAGQAIYLTDESGDLQFVAAQRASMLPNFARPDSFNLQPSAGSADGRPSSLNDDGTLTFQVTQGQRQGIFTAFMPSAFSDTFDWRKEISPEFDWHGRTEGPTNWLDPKNERKTHPKLPQQGGHFRIDNEHVILSEFSADIDSLKATGQLSLHNTLVLNEPSTIENLRLSSTLTTRSQLTLSGEVTHLGGAELQLDNGHVTVSEGSSYTIPFGGKVSAIGDASSSSFSLDQSTLVNQGELGFTVDTRFNNRSGLLRINKGTVKLLGGGEHQGGGRSEFFLDGDVGLEFRGEHDFTGTVSIDGLDGLVSFDGSETIVRPKNGGVLQMNVDQHAASSTGASLNRGATVDVDTGKVVNLADFDWVSGEIKGGQIARAFVGAPTVVAVENGFHNSGDLFIPPTKVARKLSGVIRNTGTDAGVLQAGDLTFNNGMVVLEEESLWATSGGTLESLGPNDRIVVQDVSAFFKLPGETEDSVVEVFLEVWDGGQIANLSSSSNLVLLGGGEFLSSSKVSRISPTLGSNGGRIVLGAREGQSATYKASSNLSVVGRHSPDEGSFVIAENAILATSPDAMIVLGSRLGAEVDITLDGGAITGNVTNLNVFHWSHGDVGRPDAPADFVNDGGRMIIEGGNDIPRVGRGTFLNHHRTSEGSPVEFGQILQSRDLELGNATFENAASWIISEGADINVANDQSARISNSGHFAITPGGVSDSTTIEADFDNTGSFAAEGSDDPGDGTFSVLMSGQIEQFANRQISAGTWSLKNVVFSTSEATEPVQVIGENAVVELWNARFDPPLQLAQIRGELGLWEQQMQSPTGLSIQGSLDVLSESHMRINGALEQHGSLTVDDSSLMDVLNGDVRFGANSDTTIDGQFNVIPQPGTQRDIVLNEGAVLGGNGMINNKEVADVVRFLNRNGRLQVGNSPGSLTINAQYVQEPNATLEIELRGLTAAEEYDQLSIAGTASLAGTLELKLLEDETRDLFRPANGTPFQILNADGGITSEFDEVVFNTPGVLVDLDISYADGNVVVTVLDTTLLGDFDNDDEWTSADIDLLSAAVIAGTNNEAFDLTGDVLVNTEDVKEFLSFVRSVPGDADLDGNVAFDDFLTLAASFEQGGLWSQGDFDVDGGIQFPDFLLLASNFDSLPNEASSVPEPGTGLLGTGLLWMGFVGCVAVRRRRFRLS